MKNQKLGFEYSIIRLGRLRAILIISLINGFCGQALATITGAHGMVLPSWGGTTFCTGNIESFSDNYYKGNACTLTPAVNQFVPVSGNYKVQVHFPGAMVDAYSTTAYFDETKPINEQNVTVSSSDVHNIFPPPNGTHSLCYNLVDASGKAFFLKLADQAGTNCTSGSDPLPPTPPITPTSCKINDGAALTVDLKTVDRSALPTVPGTGAIRHFPVDVECTGGIDVSVSMKFSYTPISVSGKQVIQSSSNGLGVAVIYNGQAISTTDATPVTFISGSNTLDLGFQAVRDPAVEVADVPTGAFTASAILVMTQQ